MDLIPKNLLTSGAPNFAAKIKAHWLHKILALWLFTICFSPIKGQNFQFELIPAELGLSQNFISDIAVDSTGFIWLGTPSGLNRFDGYAFKIYKNDKSDSTSLGNNRVLKLLVDLDGALWVGHGSGLQVFNPLSGSFEVVPIAQNVSVSILALDKSNNIWAIDSHRTIHRISRRRTSDYAVESYPNMIPDSPQKDDVIRSIGVDGEGRFWVHAGSFLGLIDFTDPEPKMKYVDWTSCSQKDEKRLDEVVSATPIQNDYRLQGITIGNEGQVFIYDEGALSTIVKGEINTLWIDELKNADQVVHASSRFYAYHDKSNILWLYTSTAGAHFGVDLNTYMILPKNTEIFEQIGVGITCITKSENGVYWASTNGNGLYKGVPNRSIFNSQPASSMIPTSSIYPVYKDENGHIWYFTKRTIMVIPDGSIHPQEVAFGIDNYNHVRASEDAEFDFSAKFIKGDGNGGLWIGNYDGLHHFHIDGTTVLKHDYFPIEQKSRNGDDDFLLGVYDLIIDDDDSIWIATAGEFGKFDPKTGVFDGLPFLNRFGTFDDNRISNRIVQTATKDFWIGTPNGLVKYDRSTKSFETLTHNPNDSNSLANNHIKSLCIDPTDPNVIWIGTNGAGLDRLDQRTLLFDHFTEKAGLPDQTIYGILSNGEQLWLSTNKGLCSFHTQNHSVNTYTVSDGLQDNEFNTRSFCKASDNELIFGGIKGINRFYPDSLFRSNENPETIISQVKINNRPVTFSSDSQVLSHPIESARDIWLRPDAQMVSFQVTGMDLSLPEKTEYQYKLVNFDPSWNIIGRDRNITFTSLPFGDYTLQVKSTNRSAKWSSKIKELNIHVLPPWWRTWWAYTIYALVIIGLVVFIYRYQLEREHEKREAQRLLELDTLKSRIFTNITHEFRTPLTVILGMTGMIKNNETYTQAIHENANNLLEMVNQILDLSKLEADKLEANYINGDIISYLRYLTESLRSTADIQEKELIFQSGVEQLLMDYDEVKTRQILLNLLSNAFKFTSKGDRITVKVRLGDENMLVVEVEDSGIGIPTEKLNHIFERFYQVDDSETRQAQGSGIGLALSFELVKLLGGKLEVDSELNKGSTFRFFLPIKNQSEAAEFYKAPVKASVPVSPGVPLPEEKDKPFLLLVEDNYQIVQFVQLLLQSTYHILHAENGKAGIEMAIKHIPDIIISDVMMPFKNGYEVTETLKADMRTSHIPIVLLTAKSTQEDRNTGLKHGADAYLNKPFDKDELEIRLEKLIALRKTLISRFKNLEESELENDQLENQFLVKVKDVVLQNIDNSEYRIDQLERALNLSKMQLYRKLKALTGMSPTIVVRDIRLNEAAKLLKQGELNVSEIAYAVGFNDPSYFTRAFKEKFGVAPSQYHR